MLKTIRQHIIFRYFFGFMAFYILNCSVDTPDAMPENIAEDLSYNDMESVVEIVVEQVLGFDGAIAEYDDHDTDDNSALELKKNLDTFTIPYWGIKLRLKKILPTENPQLAFCIDEYYEQFINAPNSPPPQV